MEALSLKIRQDNRAFMRNWLILLPKPANKALNRKEKLRVNVLRHS
jgi:hypothetical protein